MRVMMGGDAQTCLEGMWVAPGRRMARGNVSSIARRPVSTWKEVVLPGRWERPGFPRATGANVVRLGGRPAMLNTGMPARRGNAQALVPTGVSAVAPASASPSWTLRAACPVSARTRGCAVNSVIQPSGNTPVIPPIAWGMRSSWVAPMRGNARRRRCRARQDVPSS